MMEENQFAILALYIFGDDYAALRARDEYGHDRLFDEVIKHGSPAEEYDYFECRVRLYRFESVSARRDANRILEEAIRHVQDYDHSKHYDAWFRDLTKEELVSFLNPIESEEEEDEDEEVEESTEKRKAQEEIGDEKTSKRTKIETG